MESILDEREKVLSEREKVLSKREKVLSKREERVKEREKGLALRNEKDRGLVIEKVGATVEFGVEDILASIPVAAADFVAWDEMLKGKAAAMKAFYLRINLKDEAAFLKECIQQTFEENFVTKITFEYGSPYNKSNILRCLIETAQSKFKKDYDDKEIRKIIVDVFKQFRQTIGKRNKKLD